MPRLFTVTELSGVRNKLLLGLAMLIALASASIVLDLVHGKKDHEQQARQASRNMSLALDQSITASVERSNIVLQSSVDFMEDRLRRKAGLHFKDVNAYFLTQQSRVPELMSIRASDANGLVRFGHEVDPVDSASWATRDFFDLHKANPELGLFVSNPVVGKVSNRWVIALVRRYNYPNGSFAGVVAAAIPVEYFEALLSTMDVGTFGTAVLRDSNQALIARFPHVNGPSGVIGSKGFSKELAAAMASGEKVVTYHAVNTSDGPERINTYRRLSTVPFHLLAGQGAKDYLGDFSREVAYGVAQFMLYGVVVFMGGWLLWRSIRHSTLEHERNSALLRGASDGIHVLDSQGNLVEASDSFFAMLGYEREQGMGLNAKAWETPQSLEDLALMTASLLKQGQTTRSTQHRRKDGTEFPVEVNMLQVEMHGNTMLFNSSRDVSARKRAEEELQQSHDQLNALNASLEARVTQRTQELRAALKLAEAASRSRAEFLANTSHEIRTPMNSVLGMAYMALQANTDPQQREYLEKIQRLGGHLMRIIDDILDFSKIDAGKLELEITSFDLDLSLEHLRHWTEDRAKDKGLYLRLECGDDIPRLLVGDPLRIKQILLNFVSNAIKFTDHGSVVVRLHCLERNAQDCVIRFDVEDTGIGLSAEECARMFQSFEQADTSITRKYGGTGLGLAICRQLAHLMGGEVGVSSVPGMGSTFWFRVRLPLGQVLQREAHADHRLSEAKAALRGTAMLVVDDNAFNLDVAKGLLEGLGVEVHTAVDGAQAIGVLRSKLFDCVLMDVQMPVMDGLEASRRIRADAQLADTLVIAMTANASGTDHARCLEAGMNDVVRKPVDPEKMFIVLATHLQRRGVGLALVASPLVALPATPLVAAQVDVPAQWDRLTLQAYVGDQPARQQKLLATYLKSAKEALRAARLAIDAKDWSAAAAQGHKLKSSSRCVGAMQLANVCEALEHAGKCGNAEVCRALEAQVQLDFVELHALMEADLEAYADTSFLGTREIAAQFDAKQIV